MPEVLRVDIPEGATRPLVQPRAVLDPATNAEVERLVAAAAAQAFAEGERAGRAENARVAAAVERAFGAVRDELVAQRNEATRASLAVAEAVATAVVGGTPPADALAVLDQVHEAAAALDDDPITVALNPADHAALADAPLTDRRLDLTADARVPAGQARLEGAHGGADLTRQRLLAAALEVLSEGAR